MPKFFVDDVAGEMVELTGPDGAHIAKSLRMREGEELTVCDAQGYDHRCAVVSAQGDRVMLRVLEKKRCEAEPSLAVTLFQCLTKGDKMDTIVQKAVELGVERIVPVLSCRSVSRPDEKAAAKKRERWQKIAREAAMQAGRGKVPQVAPVTGFREAVRAFSAFRWLLSATKEAENRSLRSCSRLFHRPLCSSGRREASRRRKSTP